MIGTTLAHYRITAALGAGGMGEVWRAEDTKLGREAALKVLPADVAEDPERLARFEREAKVLASLNHPNIATLFGLETVASGSGTGSGSGSNAVTFLVMELVEGEDLSDRISRGKIPIDEAIPIALQIAEALEAAHESGIVHRDLKPANIKLRQDGTVKVLDFGLAKAWESESSDSSLSLSPTLTQHATMEGVILGTAAYMSPEQAAGTQADRRADIWSFGVVLWEMLTGHKLFDGETVSHVLASVLKDEVDDNELPDSTPPRIRRLIGRCLRRKPKQRLQSIGDARIILEEELAEPDSNPARPAAALAVETRWSWWKRGLPWGLVVILAVIVGFSTWSRQSPRVVHSTVLAPAKGQIRSDMGLALSPDGTHLAFVAESEGVLRIWIRPLDSISARALVGTENAKLPFWSPDGRHLGFFADGKLKRVSMVGGATRVLADAVDPRGGAWGDDDRIVFSPDYRDGLWMASAAGGESRRLTTLDQQRGEKSHRWPIFLPDGQRVLFLAQTDEGGASNDQSAIEALDLDNGRRTRVLEVNSSMACDPRGILVYWRSGSLFAQGFDPKKLTVDSDPVLVAEKVEYTQNERGVFSISSEGTLVYHIGAGMGQLAKLEWYSRDGELQVEAAPYDSYLQLSLDPDGRRLAYTDGLTVWSRDLVRGTATRVTHDDRDYFTPLWSPDGMWLAYATNRIGGGEIRKMRASGLGDEELVATLDHQAELRSWSPDGRFLAYEALSPGTEWDCWIYSFEEGESRRIVGSKYTDGDPVFSPDGRWLAFWSNESGRTEIYVVPVDDLGRKWQVSTDGGRFPVWNPTGAEIYFSDDENRLMAVSVELQGDVKIGTPRMLFPMPEQPVPTGAFDFAEFAVSPDGERFLLHHAQDQERISESLVLVQSWPEITRGGSE